MKKVIEKMFGWILVSNRKKHMLAGWCESIIFLFLYGILAALLDFNVDGKSGETVLVIVSILNALSCCYSMCAVEYIQKAQGGRWDWKDITAGILPAILIMAVIALIVLAF